MVGGLFSTMRVSLQDQVEGRFSCILKHVLLVFFKPNGLSFLLGVHLKGGNHGDFFMKIGMGCLIQDMKAHQGCNSVKGSAGIKCCIKCTKYLQH